MPIRPNDYGDQFPSDQGDTSPSNPASNFSEVDYNAKKTNQSSGSTVRPNQILYPDQRVSDAAEPPRVDFTGVLLRKQTAEGVHPSIWTCIRQDGKYGTAQLYGDEGGVYQNYRAGDQVSLHGGQESNTWWIVAAPRNNKQPVLELKLAAGTSTNLEKIIPFSTIVTDFATQDQSIVKDPAGSGGVIVNTDISAMYDIEFQVTVTNVSSADSQLMQVGQHCKTTTGNFPTEAKGTKLLFDNNSGFFVSKYDDDCKVYIGIKGKTDDQILWQPPTGTARWTSNPRCGGTLSVGTKTGNGWIKIGGESGVWLGNGAANVKYRFPDEAPREGDVLAIGAVSGSCVQLYHRGYGGTGNISVYDCNSGCNTYVFERGLLISGPGITPGTWRNNKPTSANCSEQIVTDPSSCQGST